MQGGAVLPLPKGVGTRVSRGTAVVPRQLSGDPLHPALGARHGNAPRHVLTGCCCALGAPSVPRGGDPAEPPRPALRVHDPVVWRSHHDALWALQLNPTQS